MVFARLHPRSVTAPCRALLLGQGRRLVWVAHVALLDGCLVQQAFGNQRAASGFQLQTFAILDQGFDAIEHGDVERAPDDGDQARERKEIHPTHL